MIGVRVAAGRGFMRADRLRRFDAVHARHVDVGQHDVEALARHRLHRRFAGSDFDQRWPRRRSNSRVSKRVDRVVFGQQDLAAPLNRLRGLRLRPRRRRRRCRPADAPARHGRRSVRPAGLAHRLDQIAGKPLCHHCGKTAVRAAGVSSTRAGTFRHPACARIGVGVGACIDQYAVEMLLRIVFLGERASTLAAGARTCAVRPSRRIALRVTMAKLRPTSGACRQLRRAGFDDHGGKGEPELAAAARRGLDADLAAHRLDQTAWQIARPRPVPPNLRAWLESACTNSLENLLALFRRHADAGVAHVESQKAPFAPLDHHRVDATPPLAR